MQDLWAKVSSLAPTVPLIAFANHVIQDQTAQYLCLEQGYDVIGYLIMCLYQICLKLAPGYVQLVCFIDIGLCTLDKNKKILNLSKLKEFGYPKSNHDSKFEIQFKGKKSIRQGEKCW